MDEHEDPDMKIVHWLLSYCEHPMIVRREDGGTYCTECEARVA